MNIYQPSFSLSRRQYLILFLFCVDVRQDYKPEGLDGIHSNESLDDGKAYLRHSEVMDAKASNSSGVAGEEMADAILMRDRLGKEVKSVMNPEDEMKQGDIHPRNDRKQMDSR